VPSPSSWASPTCLTHPLPEALKVPQTLGSSWRISPHSQVSLAGTGHGCCQGLVGGSQPPSAQLGPLWKARQSRICPSLQAPCSAGGPRGGCWGWARLPSEGKFWVWVPSSWAHTAHVPSPCGRETPEIKKSPFPAPRPDPPPLSRFPARRPAAPACLPASPTHFCSKAAMSRESRMFSSGSQVLYLPSHACTK
jgi:hypothetical protein